MIEIVDTKEKIDGFLKLVDAVIDEGIATLEEVHIHFYRAGKPNAACTTIVRRIVMYKPASSLPLRGLLLVILCATGPAVGQPFSRDLRVDVTVNQIGFAPGAAKRCVLKVSRPAAI